MADLAPQEGSYGKLVFGSTTYHLSGWTRSEGGDDADVTNSGSNGRKLAHVVNRLDEYTVEGAWDNSNILVRNPDRITRGQTGTGQFYTSQESYYSQAVKVLSVEVTSDVNGLVTFTANMQATGEVTYPAKALLSSSSSSSSSSS